MPEFAGTYSDLVFLSVYKLIHNGPRLLKPIYKSIIAIISNISPYTKKLCREACDGIMYLVQVFSKKEFLLEKEDNCKSLTSLFEAINYLIAYHDETNQYLQIQLMKYQTMFDYFDANDFELSLTTVPAASVQSEGTSLNESASVKEEVEEEKVSLVGGQSSKDLPKIDNPVEDSSP